MGFLINTNYLTISVPCGEIFFQNEFSNFICCFRIKESLDFENLQPVIEMD